MGVDHPLTVRIHSCLQVLESCPLLGVRMKGSQDNCFKEYNDEFVSGKKTIDGSVRLRRGQE